MNERELLRKEHNIRRIDGTYKKLLGAECVNCGSNENIEYHHIVPLCVGGTNKLTNIVPVCIRCHKAIHGEKDYREYSAIKNKGKRKSYTEYESDFEKYINCEIDKKTLKGILGIKGALNNCASYKSFLKSHGIKRVINNVSELIEDCNYPPPKNTELGRIIYTNDTIRLILYQ